MTCPDTHHCLAVCVKWWPTSTDFRADGGCTRPVVRVAQVQACEVLRLEPIKSIKRPLALKWMQWICEAEGRAHRARTLTWIWRKLFNLFFACRFTDRGHFLHATEPELLQAVQAKLNPWNIFSCAQLISQRFSKHPLFEYFSTCKLLTLLLLSW